MNVQHSSRSDNWHTPSAILELVRKVLGQIDFMISLYPYK